MFTYPASPAHFFNCGSLRTNLGYIAQLAKHAQTARQYHNVRLALTIAQKQDDSKSAGNGIIPVKFEL